MHKPPQWVIPNCLPCVMSTVGWRPISIRCHSDSLGLACWCSPMVSVTLSRLLQSLLRHLTISIDSSLIEKNHRRAFMKLEAFIDSKTSICLALMFICIKSYAPCLLLASPHLLCYATAIHSPKASRPTKEKGGSVLSWTSVRSDIFWVSVFLCSLRDMTQWWRMLLMHSFPPISHRPTALKGPYVIWHSWCWACSW